MTASATATAFDYDDISELNMQTTEEMLDAYDIEGHDLPQEQPADAHVADVAVEVEAEAELEVVAQETDAAPALTLEVSAEDQLDPEVLAAEFAALSDVPELDEEEEAAAPVILTPEERHALQLRVVEAILFAASQPLDQKTIELHLSRGPAGKNDDGQDADVAALIAELQSSLSSRGVQLFEIAGRWALRTAPDLADYLKTETTKPVKLSKAMSEVLAIVAYHQPVTRAEIEAIRGVATSKGTLDFLMEVGWVRPGHRRDTPGRPLTWITTPSFLDHFGLSSTNDLPGMDELKAAGLLDSKMATTYGVVAPSEAELPPAIDGEGQDSEPEFLPSEESAAESAQTEEAAEIVVAEEIAADESDDADEFSVEASAEIVEEDIVAEDSDDEDDDDFDDDDDDIVDEDDSDFDDDDDDDDFDDEGEQASTSDDESAVADQDETEAVEQDEEAHVRETEVA